MAKLRGELGLPPDQGIFRVEIPPDALFGKSWADWRYEAFGITGTWTPTDPLPSPALVIPGDDGAAAGMIHLWLQAVWRDGSPLAIERRWHPARSQRDYVTGLEHPHTTAQRTQVWRGLDLLNLVQKHPGGAPKGPRKGRDWSKRRILTWWRVSSEEYVGLGETPTLQDLASAMGAKDPETARRRLNDVGLSWPPE